MDVLFIILRVTGTAIGIILLCLLILLLLLLFYPCKYRLAGEIPADRTNGPFLSAEGSFWWLFHVLTVEAKGSVGGFEGDGKGVDFKVKILGFTFYPRKQKQEKSKKNRALKKTGSRTAEQTGTQKEMMTDRITESPTEEEKDNRRERSTEKNCQNEKMDKEKTDREKTDGEKTDGEKTDGEKTDGEKTDGEKTDRKKTDGEKTDRKKTDSEAKNGIYTEKILDKFKYTFGNICDKINDAAKRYKRIQGIINNEDYKKAVSRLFENVFKILGHISPKSGGMKLAFGFSKPYLTGEAVAAFSMLYPVCGRWLHINPDFEQEYLQADFDFKGRMLVAVLLWNVFQIMKDEQLKLLKADIAALGE